MIFFLINNNYHYLDLEKHLPVLSDFQLGLIQIPHTLDLYYAQASGLPIYNYPPILTGRLFDMLPWRIIATRRAIRRDLNIGPDDILIMYTEHEVANHLVAEHFRAHGATIYLLEEGLATYLECSFLHEEKLGFKRRIVWWYLRYVIGLKRSRPSHSSTLAPFLLADDTYCGILLYLDIKLLREISPKIICKDYTRIEQLDQESLLFLNEDNYYCYETFDSYIIGLETLMSLVSERFRKVYFKFHPREYRNPLEVLEQIRGVLGRFKNIEIIESKEPVERLIGEFRPKFVMSYMSIALINLHYYGLEPMFVYTLYPHLREHRDFRKITEVLDKLGYHFIESEDMIHNRYQSGLATDMQAQSIADILRVK